MRGWRIEAADSSAAAPRTPRSRTRAEETAFDLVLEPHRLVIARRGANVAEREPVFDQSGSSLALAGLKTHRVFTN